VLADSHDGGHTWQVQNLGVEAVYDLQIAGGTMWADIACTGKAPPCVRLVSQPVTGGAWTNLPAVPKSVQGKATPLIGPSIPELLRFGAEAWMWNDVQQRPALIRSGDDGRSWQSLPLPCGQYNRMFLGASSDDQLMLYCSVVGGLGAPPREVWTSSDGGSQWTLESRAGYQNGLARFDIGRDIDKLAPGHRDERQSGRVDEVHTFGNPGEKPGLDRTQFSVSMVGPGENLVSNGKPFCACLKLFDCT